MVAIRETFFQECEEQLGALESGLLSMDAGACDPETVNAVFRAVHSIKGGAGAFGLDALVRFAHVFETAMDDVRAGRLVPDSALLMLMLRAADALADLVRAARDDVPIDEDQHRALVIELSVLAERPSAAPPEPEPEPVRIGHTEATVADGGMEGLVFEAVRFEFDPLAPAIGREWRIRFQPRAELYAKANDAAAVIRELGRLGEIAVELDRSGLPPFAELDPEGAYFSWTIRLTTGQPESAIREVFEFVDLDCELEIVAVTEDAPGPPGSAVGAEAETHQEPGPKRVAGNTAGTVPPIVETARSAGAAAIAAAPGSPELDTRAPAGTPANDSGAAKPTIRVDLFRVDRLVDLVGELVINQAMLAQRVVEAGMTRHSNVALGFSDLEQLTRDIQDSVMAIRAQPVKSVFQRMPRLVREVAAMTRKQVRLVTEGENTEVDKTVIEHLADPLTHMIRNAIDHGLERPEERLAVGKPAEGTVRVAARHRSGRIIIEVGDDGAGIDRGRVRASAIAKGLIAADAVLGDDDIDNLIFMPGFSTADAISDISGRGVGMDVVKRSVQSLGGRIAITSRPGQGSTFTMSMPLTLAVLDGMVVTVAGQTLVAPLTAITETLRPRVGDVHSLGGDTAVIAIRGSYVPLLDVGAALHYREERVDPTGGIALLVEGEGGSRAALLVDAIQGQRQVVIKSLEANYRPIPGIAAATILGDGRVALILDVDAIVTASRAGLPRLENSVTGMRAYA